MTRFWFSDAGVNWRAAALIGLISSTFSTLVSQLTAARIGRDAVVDWMVVAAIPLRDPALQVEPSWGIILAGIAVFGWLGRELPWMGHDAAYDQSYMRRMSAHPEQGIVVARIAAERASDPHLRALARLMAAAQQGEIAIFARWWQSCFDGFLPGCSLAEEAGMPGMLRMDPIEQLRGAEGAAFDRLFVELMTQHHRGAIQMADEAIERASDPRLKLMSHAIR